jgi:hypothetical protein
MLHTDSIDGGSEAIYRPGHVPGWGRTSNTLTVISFLRNIILNTFNSLIYITISVFA